MMKRMMKKVGMMMVVTSLVIGGHAFAATANANVNEGNTLIADKVVENRDMVNKVKIGKTISVLVDENVTTGYSWTIKVEGDQKAVKTSFVDAKVENKEKTANTNQPLVCGAGVQKELIVKGLAKGKATITMTYARPFEKNVAPIKTMVFVVNVEK